MAKLLITGDTGLLGSNLAHAARRLHQVFGVSRATEAISASWDHRSIDLTDGNAALHYLDETRPEVIVHCAAVTDVERCEMQPAYAHAVNVEATEGLAQWAEKNGAQFTFVSTDSIFDGVAGGYREEDTPRPLNQYARTKLAGEEIVARACTNSLIVRTNFYGWNQSGKPNLGKWMHGKLLRGEPLMAFTDVRFNPLFVRDLAKLILSLISREAKGVFHVAARDLCSKYEFALLLGRAFLLDTRKVESILLEDFPFQARRPRNTSLTVTKCAKFLGRETPTVEQGVIAFEKTLVMNNSARVEGVQMQASAAFTPR
ncbi:MAG: SDR family oxidoreductase [Candidatus Acidiferrales bacterium]